MDFIPTFTRLKLDFALLYISKASYNKGVIQATRTITEFLKEINIHNYSTQNIGFEEFGVEKQIKLILSNQTKDLTVSMYRSTDGGKNKIWFRGIKKHIQPDSIVAMIYKEDKLYLINLNDKDVKNSILNKEYVYEILTGLSNFIDDSYELYEKIKHLHDKGFVKSIYNGPGSAGETLEFYLGIDRNSSKNPDYKNIELKTYNPNESRLTLLNKFPKWEDYSCKTKKGFLEKYANSEYKNDKRTFFHRIHANKVSSKGFYLDFDINSQYLKLMHENDGYVLGWDIIEIKKALKIKHSQTFWVETEREKRVDGEYFKYNKITYTKDPYINLLPALIMNGIIYVNFSMSLDKNGHIEAHSCAFIISKYKLNMLFAILRVYDLN